MNVNLWELNWIPYNFICMYIDMHAGFFGTSILTCVRSGHHQMAPVCCRETRSRVSAFRSRPTWTANIRSSPSCRSRSSTTWWRHCATRSAPPASFRARGSTTSVTAMVRPSAGVYERQTEWDGRLWLTGGYWWFWFLTAVAVNRDDGQNLRYPHWRHVACRPSFPVLYYGSKSLPVNRCL